LAKSDRVLWIDQLCINQINLNELGHQVRKMSQIYKSARRVIVWVGILSASANHIAKDLAAQGDALGTDKSLSGPPFPTSAVTELYKRTYWDRVWIWQELFFARSFIIQIGEQTLPDRAFIDYYQRCLGSSQILPQLLEPSVLDFVLQQRPDYPKQRKGGVTSGYTLLHCLDVALMNKLQCARAHDFIYAFMGIASDHPMSLIEVDYEKPLDQLYEETLFFCIQPSHWPTEYKVNFATRLAERLGVAMDKHTIAGRFVYSYSSDKPMSRIFRDPTSQELVRKDVRARRRGPDGKPARS
jgi:hypothetical protein